VDTIVQSVVDLLDSKRAHTSRGKLDGQRQAIESRADAADR
jgi:hypothetical protein